MASGASVEYGNTSEKALKNAKIDENFFTGYRKTLIPDEDLLVRITIPYCPKNGHFLGIVHTYPYNMFSKFVKNVRILLFLDPVFRAP